MRAGEGNVQECPEGERKGRKRNRFELVLNIWLAYRGPWRTQWLTPCANASTIQCLAEHTAVSIYHCSEAEQHFNKYVLTDELSSPKITGHKTKKPGYNLAQFLLVVACTAHFMYQIPTLNPRCHSYRTRDALSAAASWSCASISLFHLSSRIALRMPWTLTSPPTDIPPYH